MIWHLKTKPKIGKKVFKDYFFKAFKKVRLTNKQKVKNSEMNDLLHRRKKLKSKQNVTEKDDEEIENIEKTIAEMYMRLGLMMIISPCFMKQTKKHMLLYKPQVE